ncbi:MAG: FAD-dependent monooxygenase [Vulcanimicrobiaceae bacterium]
MGVGPLPVLIVGAGPTGLVLALWLAKSGIALRIVDRAVERSRTSRAVGVQARTLEFYRQLGIADAVVDAGTPLVGVRLWSRGKRIGRMAFGRMGRGLSPYPFMLIYPQDAHERLLARELATFGVEIERGIEFVGLDQRPDTVLARLRHDDGRIEEVEARYLAGCDGGHSAVRRALGASFDGGTYDHTFYVADVVCEGDALDGDAQGVLDADGFLAIFPMKGVGHARLIGAVRDDPGEPGRPLTWGDVDAHVLESIDLRVCDVRWFSTYRIHHRVASRFRSGRAFLLGDAAHVHSPVGGQGMNTGIGDAVNLAWKLAAVLDGGGAETLLDTYEPERIAFARRLVATTDRAFVLIASPSAVARRLRPLVTRAFAALSHLRRVRRLAFLTVSQLAVTYRGNALACGAAGRIRAGDRLPWVVVDPKTGADNHAPLASRRWQVHAYDSVSPHVRTTCAGTGIALHVFPWRSAFRRVGLVRGAIFVVRPDGYIGYAGRGRCGAEIARYLRENAPDARRSVAT